MIVQKVIFRFFIIPASSRLEVVLENLIQLIFLEEFLVLQLGPDDPRFKVDVLRRGSSPKVSYCSICYKEYEVYTSPDSLRVHCITEK